MKEQMVEPFSRAYKERIQKEVRFLLKLSWDEFSRGLNGM